MRDNNKWLNLRESDRKHIGIHSTEVLYVIKATEQEQGTETEIVNEGQRTEPGVYIRHRHNITILLIICDWYLLYQVLYDS